MIILGLIYSYGLTICRHLGVSKNMVIKHPMTIMLIGFLGMLSSFYTSLVSAQDMSPNFYDTSCPGLASIVSSTFQSLAQSNNVVSPSTLRMLMHDCFIQVMESLDLITKYTNEEYMNVC